MASLVLSGDTSGTITVSAPAVSGSNTQTLVATTGTLAPIVSGTAVSASGTSVDFTSIPSWVKRITVMFSNVSLSGTDNVLVQLGDSGGVENTGYVSISSQISSSVTTASNTTGFLIQLGTAARGLQGSMQITLLSGNEWVQSGTFNDGVGNTSCVSGSKTLSATLDRISITRTGTNTFDAGSINILYE